MQRNTNRYPVREHFLKEFESRKTLLKPEFLVTYPTYVLSVLANIFDISNDTLRHQARHDDNIKDAIAYFREVAGDVIADRIKAALDGAS